MAILRPYRLFCLAMLMGWPMAGQAQTAAPVLTVPNAPSAPNAPAASAPSGTPTIGEVNHLTELFRQHQYVEARALAQNLAARGESRSALLAAVMAVNGDGGPADLAEATRLYRQAAQAREPEAAVALANMAIGQENGVSIGEAISFLEPLVTAPNIDAEMMGHIKLALADCLMSLPVPQTGRAFELYRQLGMGGNADAAYRAAVLADDGDIDPPDDPALARQLLQIAADGGVNQARADLGLLLYQGRGGPRDLPAAAALFAQSARAGDREGAFYWAYVNTRGEGVARNIPEALRWAEIAAGSSPEADRLLAFLRAHANDGPATGAPANGSGH